MRPKAFPRTLVLVALLVQAGLAQINDNFNDSFLDPRLWTVLVSPPGQAGTVSEINQRLEITLGPGLGSTGIASVCQFTGDFDVQVDYILLNWPATNLHSVRLGSPDLGVGPGGGIGLNRSSFPNGLSGEFYLLALPNADPQMATTQLSGKLRLVRTGATLSGFAMVGTTWVPIGSGPVSTAATHISLDLGAGSSTAQGGVSSAFDNFQTNAGTVSCACSPLIVEPALKQFFPPWGSHTYDDAATWATTGQKTTIARWGCHLTSAVMLINYQASQQGNSFRSDPDDLNTWLEAHSAPYKSSGSVWGPDVQLYVKQKTNGSLGVFYQGLIDKQDDFVLDSYLCANNPVILQVPVAGSTHFVLATGQTIVNGRSTFKINDPNYNVADLSQGSYNFRYLGIREYSASRTPPHALLISGHSPIEFVATDPAGNETGFDPTTGTHFSQIPSSSYATDSILDDIDPLSGDTTPVVKNLEVLAPLSGTFNLKVFGTGIGDFTLDFVAHDINGNESVQSLTGSTIPGAIATFAIAYSSAVGSTVSVTHIVTFNTLAADVGVARAAGLIHNNGIVNSLLQKLQAASVAVTGGEVNTAADILGAFVNEVFAQAGKHIDATAVNLLTSDVAALLSSLGA